MKRFNKSLSLTGFKKTKGRRTKCKKQKRRRNTRRRYMRGGWGETIAAPTIKLTGGAMKGGWGQAPPPM